MRQILLVFALLLSIFTLNLSAQHLVTGGEVVDIIDGKTIVVATQTRRVKIELQFIEVPEPEQPMHETVKAHLRQLLIGKVVEYKVFRLYDVHTLGRVMLKGVDISQQMLRDGAAWHIPLAVAGQDKSEHDVYAATEAAAKSENRGIWSGAGLKPAWEFRAEKAAKAAQVVKTAEPLIAYTPPQTRKKQGAWADDNPALGDVGALTHGYNAQKRIGYVSTMFAGVEQSDEEKSSKASTMIDVTYHYKQNPQEGRSGIFVITILSYAENPRFTKNNDLILVDDKKLVIGKAQREISPYGDLVKEKLTYQVERSSIEKLVFGTGVLKIGERLIEPKNFAYAILHNMLQVSGKARLASAEGAKRKPASN